MGSSRRIEQRPQSGWGCMGGGATDHHLEGNHYPVQLYRRTVPYQYQTGYSIYTTIIYLRNYVLPLVVGSYFPLHIKYAATHFYLPPIACSS
jgi:hypothetical protein